MKLHQYQQRIIDFVSTQKRAVLTVDMGLGKTAPVLHYLDHVRPQSALIIAPLLVAKTVWTAEAEKWGLQYVLDRMTIVCGPKKKRQAALSDTSRPYKVISESVISDVENTVWDIVIIDELSLFKTVDSMRAKCIQTIKARQYIGMTGTYVANGAIDIFGQLAAMRITKATHRVNGKYKWCPEFEAWRAEHFKNVMQGSGQSFQKWELVSSLNEVIEPFKAHFFTLMADDYLDIPEVSYITHKVKLSDEEYKNYMQLKTILSVDMNDGTFAIGEDAKFAKLQTMCNGFIYDKHGVPHRGKVSSKLTEVSDFCELCAMNHEPVLLLYGFREEAVWLYEKLLAKKLRVTSVKDKDFLRKWESGDIDVLMSHPASVCYGLNLQHHGRICGWSSIPYNYDHWAQANARLARQGQEKGVQIHIFLAADTIENDKYKSLSTKEDMNLQFKLLTK